MTKISISLREAQAMLWTIGECPLTSREVREPTPRPTQEKVLRVTTRINRAGPGTVRFLTPNQIRGLRQQGISIRIIDEVSDWATPDSI